VFSFVFLQIKLVCKAFPEATFSSAFAALTIGKEQNSNGKYSDFAPICYFKLCSSFDGGPKII